MVADGWKVKYDGTCSRCGIALRTGEVAVYDRQTRSIHCVVCPSVAAAADPPPIDTGVAGASARREYELEAAYPSVLPGTVARWLHDGRVFAVDAPGGPLFPAFQFTDGEPLAVSANVLSALAGELQGWEILMWFTGSCGYLEGARPVNRLADHPDEVVAAAAYQASLSLD